MASLEDVRRYTEGGYHPTHLGDVMKDGRYHIMHKLGFGSYSTVWLAKDHWLVSAQKSLIRMNR